MLIKGFALLLLILIPVIIFTQRKQSFTPKIIYLTPTPSSNPSLTPSSMQQSTPTSMITSAPTPESTIQPTSSSPILTLVPPTTTSGSINDFVYPNSTVQSQSGNEIIIDSTDDSTVITNWYKNKIQQMGMNTTSFITTNTNGNVSNKLVASNESIHISVDISKSSGNNEVSISISLS